ncbi:MAG: cysteine hydrolase family protein [Bacilli bacterium]
MKLLVIVDYQIDFVDGNLGFPKAQKLEEKIMKKVASYQERHDDIIFTLDTHQGDYLSTLEGQHLPIIHALSKTKGHELYGKLQNVLGRRIEKDTFGSLELVHHVQTHIYDSIELVGLVTNICVIANAILMKTACPNTPIVVDAACTASFDDDLHEKALDVMTGLQIEIRNRGN